ncbi:hypothetical protein SSCS72_02923 [Mammaliicoccus sciuri]|uniref:hypothetical protein n=1 Tax=Bacteria TaxID=2 RepID=UPI001EF69AEC|nr:hypothetical protein [Mammaliicoccus sciuri]CAG7915102.1 hypothetical protein SSCS72_02923 [Mammaliicoccus sciuri]
MNKEQVNEIILKSIKIPISDDVIIYKAGSIMEGFGNKSSDIDVYIICKLKDINNEISHSEESVISKDDTYINNFFIENIRYDIEYWDIDKVRNTIEKLNNFNFKNDIYSDRLSKDEIDFIHRIKFGVPVINTVAFNKFKSNFNFNNLSKIQVLEHTEQFEGYLEDIEGALISKDLGTVYTLTKLILEEVTSSYLSSVGETNPSRKWLYRKMLRYEEKYQDSLLLENYLKFHGYKFNENSIDTYTTELLEYIQKLNIHIQNNYKKEVI